MGSTRSIAYDPADFCRPEAAQVVILVDVTTAFDDRAKDVFQRGINGIVKSLSPGEEIRVATIEDSYASTNLLYTGCVPVCSSGLLDFFISDCTEGVIRLETAKQLNEIRAALQGRLAMATTDLDTSDIVRTIFYNTQNRQAGRDLDLYIFSDLIENSEFMSGKTFWAQATDKSITAIKTNNLMPNFSGAVVKAFGVGRGGSMGRHPLTQDRINKLRDFWTAYFIAAGAPQAVISEDLYLENQL